MFISMLLLLFLTRYNHRLCKSCVRNHLKVQTFPWKYRSLNWSRSSLNSLCDTWKSSVDWFQNKAVYCLFTVSEDNVYADLWVNNIHMFNVILLSLQSVELLRQVRFLWKDQKAWKFWKSEQTFHCCEYFLSRGFNVLAENRKWNHFMCS